MDQTPSVSPEKAMGSDFSILTFFASGPTRTEWPVPHPRAAKHVSIVLIVAGSGDRR